MPETQVQKPKFKNPHRISIADYRKAEGLSDETEYLDFVGKLVCDSVAPAMCDEGCEVEPDGRCEHGCPSLLLAAGLM